MDDEKLEAFVRRWLPPFDGADDATFKLMVAELRILVAGGALDEDDRSDYLDLEEALKGLVFWRSCSMQWQGWADQWIEKLGLKDPKCIFGRLGSQDELDKKLKLLPGSAPRVVPLCEPCGGERREEKDDPRACSWCGLLTRCVYVRQDGGTVNAPDLKSGDP